MTTYYVLVFALFVGPTPAGPSTISVTPVLMEGREECMKAGRELQQARLITKNSSRFECHEVLATIPWAQGERP